jgi:structural maintenance of chromosome 3 (chondroitin sulfate proteoglycan 6)
MHIKQIIIQGFKSYKDQTVIEPFSPGLNVIVGRNGSGKSNFFAAIRFVLSDAYTQMGREERQALLHEGSGSAVMSAYVEVIFDNSDERFPTGKPELVLRRTIGLKKDEYSLDRKNATKSDVMNLLESAGFSRSNPYYIVPQGRVTTLTNMKDPERLNLLKEVAGTQVYEARRTESLKIMQETDNKRSKIDNLLGYIEERLAELEEEKEELKKYQEKDREHRCLQYTLFHREQQECQKALRSIEDQRDAGVDETDINRAAFERLELEINQIDTQLIETEQKLDFAKLDKQQLDKDRQEAQREKAKLELEVINLTQGQSEAQNAKAKHDRDLQEVKNLIKMREDQLKKLMPTFNETKKKENEVKTQLDEAVATRKRLFDKQARFGLYKSKRDRDTFLKSQVDDISVQLATRKATLLQVDEEIGGLETEITTLEENIKQTRDQQENRDDAMHSLASEIEKAKEVEEQLQDRRKTLWRDEHKIRTSIAGAQKNLDEAERPLQGMMDRNTWQGINSVRRIKEELGLDGVYGTVGELFEISDIYRTAVEVTAGQSLFHYVVDSDDTATTVMDILREKKGGRVTFMPLNRLKPKSVNMPKTSDAIPMLSKLNYNPMFEKAFEQVFGRTVVCENMAVASQFARSHGVSAITPAGDRSDKKGALTGGHYDTSRSRIQAIRRATKARAELDGQNQRLRDIEGELGKLEQKITKAKSDIQKLRSRQLQLDNSVESSWQDRQNQEKDLYERRRILASKKKYKETLQQEQARSAKQQQAYETEMNSDFKQALSNQEQTQLGQLGPRIQELQKQLNDLASSRSELESETNGIEVELRENLRLRFDQLNSQDTGRVSGAGSSANLGSQLKDRQRALKRVEKTLADLEAKLADVEAELEEAAQGLTSLNSQKAQKLQNQEELTRANERHQKRMEKSMQKKALLNEKLAVCNRDIRDLGVLPEEAFKKYSNWDSDKVCAPLPDSKAHSNMTGYETNAPSQGVTKEVLTCQ